MLYATTRSQNDVYTAHKAIHLDCAPDGGLFVPFKLPVWEKTDLLALKDQSFGGTVAQVLNGFFSCGLTSWDVEFAIGRNAVQLEPIQHRVLIAEPWHNEKWHMDDLVQTLSDMIRKEGVGQKPTGWMEIAVSIAVLFGVFGECLQTDASVLDAPLDVAVATGAFTLPMAAWYAKNMGLPIYNIICGCNANGCVWDLVHRGEMPTGGIAVKTLASDGDVTIPRNLERLIAGTLGVQENLRFLQCCREGGLYTPPREQFEQLRRGVFASVISDQRIKSLIPSVYQTAGYIFGPYGALAYGSLMDYRAKTGEGRKAILLTDRSPICDGEMVAKVMDLSVDQLQKRLG